VGWDGTYIRYPITPSIRPKISAQQYTLSTSVYTLYTPRSCNTDTPFTPPVHP
jgi:hypothetical protein